MNPGKRAQFQIQNYQSNLPEKVIKHKQQIFRFCHKRQHTDFLQPDVLPNNQINLEKHKEFIQLSLPVGLKSTLKNNHSIEEHIINFQNTIKQIKNLNNIKQKNLNDKSKKTKNQRNIEERKIFNDKLQKSFHFLDQKFQPKYISKIIGIPYQSLMYYNSKRIKKSKFEKEQTGKASLIKQQHIDYITSLIETNKIPILSLKQIRSFLEKQFEEFKKNCSLTTISKIVKLAHFSKKRTQKQQINCNSLMTMESRFEKATLFSEYLKRGYEFIFIDETSFQENMVPICGYSKVGKPFILKQYPKKTNISLVCAISTNAIIGYQFIKGGLTAKDYACFLLNILKNCYEIRRNLGHYIFFHDNATIHHAQILNKLYNQLNIFFNAPYSPQLNPIEEFFSLLKYKVRTLKILNDGEDFIKTIDSALRQIDNKYVLKFYLHSLIYYQESLLKTEYP